MKLYYSPTSPFVRKVVITAHETGLFERIEQVPTHTTPTAQSEPLLRDNPLGKVPALVTDDGLTLIDSRVICEYLDHLHQGPKLFPDESPSRWRALRLHALGDGMMDAAVSLRYEIVLRPEAIRWDEWVKAQTDKVTRGLDLLEAEAQTLAGTVTIGTIAVACALGYLDLRYQEMAWRQGRPNLATWMEGFQTRPSYQSTSAE